MILNVCGALSPQHYSGLEEAVFRNIQACKELAQTTRTAYGPNGKTHLPLTSMTREVSDSVWIHTYALLFTKHTITPHYFSSPGMNKMVINHLEKLFVTNDAATILRELEVRLICQVYPGHCCM